MKSLVTICIAILLSAWTNGIHEKKTISGHVYSNIDASPLPGVLIKHKDGNQMTYTDKYGSYSITVPAGAIYLIFSHAGYKDREIRIGSANKIDVYLIPARNEYKLKKDRPRTQSEEMATMSAAYEAVDYTAGAGYAPADPAFMQHNTEDYSPITENIFHKPSANPLSTFSIDVDAASYSNVRRFINSSQLPPVDAVRIEEMINYFTYDYPQPNGEAPFSINTEVGSCPWNDSHYLVHIGLQGKTIPMENLPASNLVFLIDVSGSMNQSNKLPLLKSAFKMLVNELRPQDKVSIVVYAGAAGQVLPPTSGYQKNRITGSLDNLQAGGSTAGGQGIKLAYKTAREHFIEGGNNRVILATDGDFNVGESSDAAMQRLIEEKRESGIFLTVLGFGMGNYKDAKMEILADKGNGNYAYIDNILEAKKVFVNEFGGTLFTIAKDVKIQVEFNPEVVQSYRLIGYENRKLRDEDFNDDKKDAGELGSGHTVTALYEIIPIGVEDQYTGKIDERKYQEKLPVKKGKYGNEIMTVKLRYKLPDENTSKLISRIVKNDPAEFTDASDNYRFSAAVAGFGMILRDSEFRGDVDFDDILQWAMNSRGQDEEGYRNEFIRMVETAQLLGKS